MADVKQVIVMRTDLGMRKGKMIAQGAHASIAFLTMKVRGRITDYFNPEDNPLFYVVSPFRVSPEEKEWMEGRFTKVVVRVESEQELLEIYEKAKAAEVTTHLITDAGLTEFHGELTHTCVGLGPNYSDEIDKITGHLQLL
jgi:PTH2 family peptidyl-tRNA hydrolase